MLAQAFEPSFGRKYKSEISLAGRYEMVLFCRVLAAGDATGWSSRPFWAPVRRRQGLFARTSLEDSFQVDDAELGPSGQ